MRKHDTLPRLLRRSITPIAAICLTFLAAAPVLSAGRVTYLEGDVTVMRDERRIVADFGTEIREGDRVTTGTGSTVVIDLDNRVDIKLRERSTVRIDRMGRPTRVDLDSGGVFSRVRERASGQYEVRARTVTGGVRGTEFFLAYGRRIGEAPDVWLCVNTGVVEVRVLETGDEMPVRAGEGVNVLAGLRLTDARRYRWTERLNWNMDPDAGEVYDDTDLDSAYADLLDQDYD